jgi:asparagine synthase (glutamine-hydrolysing)
MCGIVGIFARTKPIAPAALAAATHRLDHRGPDRQQVWSTPNLRVGLGHARLSIIDLVTGDQPLTNEDETLHLIVNGEFYGFEEIRRDLIARGHQLRTQSDSEIVLHLYEEVGTECLHDLRGEFAFVLWDEPNQLLFAARDRFGIKPLFYAMVDDTLYLASEIKALLAAGVPARWDHESFFQQLFIYQNQDRTLFEGVYQVPPGHYLIASNHHLQLARYWDLDYPKKDGAPVGPSEDVYVERLGNVLDEAVRLRLRADVPVSCFLSGGLDSSAVLALAARAHPAPLRAFTVAFDGTDFDEKQIARQMAEHAGARFDSVSVSQADVADHVADTIAHGETLGVNWHSVARYLLCRSIHQEGYKVALSGEGADEIFAGYMQARQDALLNGNKPAQQTVAAAPPTSAHLKTAAGLPASLAFVQRTLGFVPSWIKKLAVSRSIFHILLAPDYANAFAGRDPFRIFLSQFDVQGQLAGRSPVIQSLYLWTRSILPNYTLFAERLEMAHAVEVRVPFLDHHVFELVRQMPVSLLIRGHKEKYILREVARPFLPDAVYQRPKHPFLAPPSTTNVNNRLHMLVQDTLRGSEMAKLPFFDQAMVVALLDKLPAMDESRRIALDSILMMMVCACLLRARYRL